MKLKIVNKSNNESPFYASKNAAGMDLRAYLNQPVLLEPMERGLIPTGIYIQLQEGKEAQIRPRSGLAYKNGITVLNTPGTIDSDYIGEIKVILINLSKEPYVINNGERIAQMIISNHDNAELIELDDVSEFKQTERGSGGFGHTGKN